MPALLEQARVAEVAGATSFWIASHLFLRDPFSMAAAILKATERARVVLMAVSPHVMHPVHMAMAAATLDEMAPGRVVLCLGTGAPGDLAGVGIEPARRVQTLREAIEITRALLLGEPVRYRGERFRIEGRALEGGRHAVPVYLAASGAQSLALAGAATDGVVLSAASSVPFVRWALQQLDRGRSGRRVHRASLVYTSVAVGGAAEGEPTIRDQAVGGAAEGEPTIRDQTVGGAAEGEPTIRDQTKAALDRFRRQLGIILRGSHHTSNLALAGASLDQEAVGRAIDARDWKAAEALVSDDLVRRHTASGTPEEVRAQLAAYAAAGLDEIVLAGLYDPAETTRTVLAVKG
jgi:5,10-methylenetetrahydromethanopterin reductase